MLRLVSVKRSVVVLSLSALSAACGSEADSGDENWRTIITGEWTMEPGTEGYTCVRQTVQEDFYVKAFEAINPLGTHHTLLTMGKPDKPDGASDCTAADNRTLSAFGSGVGTNPLHFPPGVALKIPAGTQLLLNLHLFNTGGEALSGISGTRIQTVEEAEVESVAEGLLAGPVRLNLPAGAETKTVGHCTMSSDVTVFAVAPHMHQLGVHQRVVAETAAGEVELFNGAYAFDEQSYQSIPPIQLAKGEKVRVECTHNNTTAKDVTFGESTLEEMCFAGLYRYPADGSYFICTEWR